VSQTYSQGYGFFLVCLVISAQQPVETPRSNFLLYKWHNVSSLKEILQVLIAKCSPCDVMVLGLHTSYNSLPSFSLSTPCSAWYKEIQIWILLISEQLCETVAHQPRALQAKISEQLVYKYENRHLVSHLTFSLNNWPCLANLFLIQTRVNFCFFLRAKYCKH